MSISQNIWSKTTHLDGKMVANMGTFDQIFYPPLALLDFEVYIFFYIFNFIPYMHKIFYPPLVFLDFGYHISSNFSFNTDISWRLSIQGTQGCGRISWLILFCRPLMNKKTVLFHIYLPVFDRSDINLSIENHFICLVWCCFVRQVNKLKPRSVKCNLLFSFYANAHSFQESMES